MALPVLAPLIGGGLGFLGGLLGANERQASEEDDRRHKMALMMAAPGLYAPNAWDIKAGSDVSPLGMGLGGLGLGVQQGTGVSNWLGSESEGKGSPTNWEALSNFFSKSPVGK